MAMPQREVKVGQHTYRFYLISGLKAFEAVRKFSAQASTLIPCLLNKEKGTSEFNEKLNDLIMDKIDYLLDTFIDKNNLYCDNTLILDFDEHFAGRFMDIPKLLYKVIMENDKDFFHSLPTLIERGLHNLNEKLQANSLPKAEQMEDVLTQVANSVKENLG